MPDWFNDLFKEVSDGPPIEVIVLSKRLLAALLFGWSIALTHRFTQGRRDDFRTGFGVTLVMLTVILALITQVIGGNAARAFTLVGALAIVRFRTRVNDTRDTAYVILAVAVGMAIGLGFYRIAWLGIPAVGIAAVLLPHLGFGGPRPDGPHQLVVRFDREIDPDAAIAPTFGKYLVSHRCDGTESAQKGTALDVTYMVRLRDVTTATAVVRELLGLPGVKAAELKRPR
jgi:uncharacterized membrane protein YhiD involved in acid resistance